MGLRCLASGFGVWGLRFLASGVGGLGFTVFGFRAWGLEFRVFGVRVSDLSLEIRAWAWGLSLGFWAKTKKQELCNGFHRTL